VVCYFQDISDRKRAEQALHTSEATLRAFYDNAPMFMGVVEPTDDDDIVHIDDNPLACGFFGVEPGSMRNRRALADLNADPTVVRTWLQHYRESRESGMPVRFEHRVSTSEGVRWLAPNAAGEFEPREEGESPYGALRQAAVALVLRGGQEGAELLVIKRSEAERDHWSGHLALPGGRAEAEDENLEATAGADEDLLTLKRKMGLAPPAPEPQAMRVAAEQGAAGPEVDEAEREELAQALAELEAEQQLSMKR
jgi:hypothetical protein